MCLNFDGFNVRPASRTRWKRFRISVGPIMRGVFRGAVITIHLMYALQTIRCVFVHFTNTKILAKSSLNKLGKVGRLQDFQTGFCRCRKEDTEVHNLKHTKKNRNLLGWTAAKIKVNLGAQTITLLLLFGQNSQTFGLKRRFLVTTKIIPSLS